MKLETLRSLVRPTITWMAGLVMFAIFAAWVAVALAQSPPAWKEASAAAAIFMPTVATIMKHWFDERTEVRRNNSK